MSVHDIGTHGGSERHHRRVIVQVARELGISTASVEQAAQHNEILISDESDPDRLVRALAQATWAQDVWPD